MLTLNNVKEEVKLLSITLNNNNTNEITKKYMYLNEETLSKLVGENVNISKYFFNDSNFIYYNYKGKWLKITYFKVTMLARVLKLTVEEAILISFGMFKEVNNEKYFTIKDVIKKLGENESEIFKGYSKKSINSFYKYFNTVNELIVNKYNYDSTNNNNNTNINTDLLVEFIENKNGIIRNLRSFTNLNYLIKVYELKDEHNNMEHIISSILSKSEYYNSLTDNKLKENIKDFVYMSYLIKDESILSHNKLGYKKYKLNCKQLSLDMDLTIKLTNKIYKGYDNLYYGRLEYTKSNYKLQDIRLNYFLKFYDNLFKPKKLTKTHLLNNMILNKNNDTLRDLFDSGIKYKDIYTDSSLILNDLRILNSIDSSLKLQEKILSSINEDLKLDISTNLNNEINILTLKDLNSLNINTKYIKSNNELIIDLSENKLEKIIEKYVDYNEDNLTLESIYNGIVKTCYKEFKKIPNSNELKMYTDLMKNYNSKYKVNIEDVLVENVKKLSSHKYDIHSLTYNELGYNKYNLYPKLFEVYQGYDYSKYYSKIINITLKSCRLLEKIVKFNLSQDNTTIIYKTDKKLNLENLNDYHMEITNEYKKYEEFGENHISEIYNNITNISFSTYENDLDLKLNKNVLEIFNYTKEDNKLYKQEFINLFVNSLEAFSNYKELNKFFTDKNILRKNINDIYINTVLNSTTLNLITRTDIKYILNMLKNNGFKDSEKLKVIRYIIGDCVNRQCINIASASIDYKDYLKMYIDLANKDMREIKDFNLEPYSLKLEHDILMKEYFVLKDKINEIDFLDSYKDEDKLGLTKLKLKEKLSNNSLRDVSLLIPKSSVEVKNEGKNLNHCVGSYISHIIKGDKLIYFLRLNDKLEESYCTVEIIKVDNVYSLGQVKMKSNKPYRHNKIKDIIRKRINEVNKQIREEMILEG